MQGFKQFFVEVSKADVQKIEDKVSDALSNDRSSLPFGDVFGDKLRMVVPYDQNVGDMGKIEDLLKKNGYKDIDFVKKTAKREVATRQGNKNMEVGIGKALSQLKDPNAKTLLDKFSAMAPVSKGDYAMVVSRHPIDVLRMSNHGWTSCHSPGGSVYSRGGAGSYYQCAVQEAKSGGGIAYIVKKSDLDGVDLQSDEIFEDKDRGISGITPLGRVRLRRIDFNGGDEQKQLLVPSGNSYGLAPSGTIETLRDWAKGIQGDALNVVKDYLDNNPRGQNSLELRGGSYSDRGDSPSEILSSLYGADLNINKIGHSSEDEEEEGKENSDEIDRRMQQSIRDHDFKNIHVSASVEDYDGPAYLMYDVFVQFSFPASSFVHEPSTSDRDLNKDIKDAVDFYSLSELRIENDGEDININMDFYDEENNNTFINFEHYMDYAERDLDKKYDSIKNKIQNILIKHEYIKNPLDDVQLKNLTKDSEGDYVSREHKFGDIHGLPNILFNDESSRLPYAMLTKETGYIVAPYMVRNSLAHSFKDYLKSHNYPYVELDIEMTPENQSEAILTTSNLREIETKPIAGNGSLSVKFNYNYDKDESIEDNIKEIKNLDEKIPELFNLANSWWKETVSKIINVWKKD